MSDRAVSSPVGIVLILGITIASVAVLFGVGGTVVSDTRADAERSQMENSMSGFSSKASLVGLGESGDQRFSLGRASEGDVTIDPDAGRVTLYVDRPDTTGREELNSTSLGAVVYESGDTEVAYQGGGVWRRQGEFSRMISPPEYHYRLETLTFPIMTVSGDDRSGGTVGGTVRSGPDSNGWFPIQGDDSRTNPLEEGTILVEVESRYCDGWEAFFTERSQGAIDESCGDDETVTVDLTVPFTLSADAPVVATEINPTGGGKGNSGGDIPDGWREDVVAPSASSEVETKLEDCRDGNCNSPPESGDIDPGEYSVSGEHTLDGVTFKTDAGDTTLAVDGDLELGQVDIDGDGDVTLYVDGELSVSGSGGVNSEGDADQFVVLVHSDGSVNFNGDSSFTGVIYAPKSTTDFNGAPAIDYKGALVSEVFNVQGNIDKLDFQPAAELEDYRLLGGSRPLTYLHVSENSVEIELD